MKSFWTIFHYANKIIRLFLYKSTICLFSITSYLYSCIETNNDQRYKLDQNQPWYPCPECNYNYDEGDVVLCDYCNNWFHQEWTKLSHIRFDLLTKCPNINFKCKYCFLKNKNCYDCGTDLNHHRQQKLYCFTCKDWFCRKCLHINHHQFKVFATRTTYWYTLFL